MRVSSALTAALFCAGLAVGCGNSARDVEDAKRSLGSWDATLRLASAQEQNGALTRPFYRDLLQAARKGVEKDRDRAAKLTRKGADGAAPLEARARALLQEIDRLEAAAK
jgi:hypothetical protein